VRELVDAIKNLVIGLFTTGKHLGRHAVMLQYPTEKWEMPERSRGIVVLLSDKETGKLNCTVCMLCMRACPSYAINIKFEKDEKGKRILKDFIVDHTICCFCGLCEDACNFAAIKLAPKYEFSTFDKEELIWHTDMLQEIGRDVSYEKPVRKKPAAKPTAKAVAKPAAKPGGDAATKPAEKPEPKPGDPEKSAEQKAASKFPDTPPPTETETDKGNNEKTGEGQK